MLKRFAAWTLALYACGADSGAGVSETVGGAQDEPSDRAQSCEPGSEQTCFCPDGQRSGSQRCTTAGQLSACTCESPGATAPVADKGAAVCPGLQGATNCDVTPYQSNELPTSMLFVIDRSRSMVCNLPPLQSSEDCEADSQPVDRTAPSKWKLTKEALARTFDTLPGGGALVGLSFFSNNGACGVDSEPTVEVDALDGAQRRELTSALDDINPDGLTPIVGATILAYAHLHQELEAPGNRYVVLLTDGSESCAPESVKRLLDDEVQRARMANIRTFVIGAPGSEGARALLSELAYRGGTAASPGCAHDIDGPAEEGDCHLDMTESDDFAKALASALGTVSTAAQSCEFAVPESGRPDDVNVQYTGPSGGPECFKKDDSRPCADGADGWQFATGVGGEPDRTKVVLCGGACDKIRKDPSARVDVLVGCKPIIVF
jgi:hypothetical protein